MDSICMNLVKLNKARQLSKDMKNSGHRCGHRCGHFNLRKEAFLDTQIHILESVVMQIMWKSTFKHLRNS